MDNNDKLLAEIGDLLIRAMDNAVTAEEFARLQQRLRSERLARQHYFDLLSTLAGMDQMQDLLMEEDAAKTMDLLTALVENEKTATAVEVKKEEKPVDSNLPKRKIHKPRPQVSRLSVVSLVLSSAALLFLMAYAFLISSGQTGAEVATLTDSVGAKWSLSDTLAEGSRLMTGPDPIQITKGIVRIQTDNGVQLLLEGPAEFRFINSDELSMNYGRIFVNVSGTAEGFSVQTQKSKIIDLGTQFGVYTDIRGETQLHVFEGKTILFAGLHNQAKKVLNLTAGQACQFSPSVDEVRSIRLSEDTFAKSIDSGVNLIWRGQKEINLADVVGGGNGFGSGRLNMGINPQNGHFVKPECRTRRCGNAYIPVASNVFVDGVFGPNGSSEQIVSSSGLRFKECPKTTGTFFADIVNTPKSIRSMKNTDGFHLQMGEINYSQEANPSIFLHANLGITFDLNAFRDRLPGVKIVQFSSLIGISDTALRTSRAAIWVLVDGQVQYCREVTGRGLADAIRIEIRDTSRFLTLAATEGSDPQSQQDQNEIGYDWCIFGTPKLRLN